MYLAMKASRHGSVASAHLQLMAPYASPNNMSICATVGPGNEDDRGGGVGGRRCHPAASGTPPPAGCLTPSQPRLPRLPSLLLFTADPPPPAPGAFPNLRIKGRIRFKGRKAPKGPSRRASGAFYGALVTRRCRGHRLTHLNNNSRRVPRPCSSPTGTRKSWLPRST